MLRVALTGGMGAGKSEVARLLAEHGAVVVDADQLARAAVAPGTDGLAEVVAAFGEGVLAEDGSLDRAALAAIVFAQLAARSRLEAIVHPRVRAAAARLEGEAAADAIVVHDIPLLAEQGPAAAARFDAVVVVHADEQVRVARLVGQRGVAEADARARIAAQADDAARRALATWVVDNGGSREDLRRQVDALWSQILQVAAGR